MAKRTDIHRVGMIQPHLYTFIGWYYLGRGGKGSVLAMSAQVEAFMVSEDAWDFKAHVFGEFGKCGVCGVGFAMGEVWQHIETMDMVHVGHVCAEKYGMLSGTNWTAIQDVRDRQLKAARTAARNSLQQARIFAAYPELEAALKTDHYIVRDIARRMPNLSEKQIALVFKITKEEAEKAIRKAAQETELHVPAPEGRVAFEGIVVSKRVHESDFGDCLKMTIKVQTPEGSWLAWGTVPSSMNPEVGQTVRIKATLVQSKDKAHFAFFKRPIAA